MKNPSRPRKVSYKYDGGQRFAEIVVPLHGRKVKKLYVQKVVESLDRLFPPEAEMDRGEDDDQDA